MCGIVGIVGKPGEYVPQQVLDTMMQKVAHRGPDSQARYDNLERGVFLGHTRLAVNDLSPLGAQPMTSASGRYTIVINGEVYNFKELRREIGSFRMVNWRGSSDTEVLLAAFDLWGFEETLNRIEGMFAMAVWDAGRSKVLLARDRFGEKPLYVGTCLNKIIFGSELSTLMSFPGFARTEDEAATDLFLTLSYIPGTMTPFKNVQKLLPGSYVELQPGRQVIEPISYWDPVRSALPARGRFSIQDVKGVIEHRLLTVVGNQMAADVPVAAFLSGGIDSSLIVAMMQEQSNRPVKTFTVGFTELAHDEASHARAVAQHLGTDHTEVALDWSDALDLVERLPDMFSEPFADSSQLPTYLVSAAARQKVTVALTGDGGDEVFGGYNRHVQGARYEKIARLLPGFVQRLTGRLLKFISQPRLAELLSLLTRVCGRGNTRVSAEHLNKIGLAFSSSGDIQTLYAHLIRRDEGLIVSQAFDTQISKLAELVSSHGLCVTERMMLMDTISYLPEDILQKVDRASMAVGLETRCPFLDHKLFEMAWSLPTGERLQGRRSKAILRDMLESRVPRHLIDRPKSGFSVPLETWLRGPLKDWLHDLVSAFAKSSPGHAKIVRTAWQSFVGGRGHLHHFLWNVAMLQAWRTRHVF